jgi:signal transduction histidine kinase
MRLHTFIQDNMEGILQQWENFARDIWPEASPSIPDLRDHAQEMLLAIVDDMETNQSEVEQHEKSFGKGGATAASKKVDSASAIHAEHRLESGFDIRALVAEYRALRASVLQLWSQADPEMRSTQVGDIMRFNECVDQLLAESVQSYSDSVEHSRSLLLGVLGHDLRSPLCAVTMMSGLLEEDVNLSAPSRKMASLIVVAAREMKQLVGDLLDFAGSHLGRKMHVKRQSMNLVELCREVIEEIRAAHPTRVFDLESDGDGNGEWDRSRLRQLMSNLLSNSVKHGAEETPIRLSIHANGHAVELGVRNQGAPIPVALQEVMFDPLSRSGCEGMSRDLRGVGLGLYIAREVVKAHGGEIGVSSDEKETAFVVKLPRQ